MVVFDWIGLAPVLVCGAGALLLVLFQLGGVESRILGRAGLIALGLALGATVRIWDLVRRQPLTFTIGSWSPPAAVNLSIRVDLIDVAFMAACLLASFPILARSEPTSRGGSVFCLASLGVAGMLFATDDLPLLAIVWSGVLILAIVRLIKLRRSAECVNFLALTLVGAPALVTSAAILSPVPNPSQPTDLLVAFALATLVLVGAASVGLGPLRQLRAVANASPNLEIMNDIVLPLVGFNLVLRAVTSTTNTLPIEVAGLLVLLGFSGLLEAAEAARKVGNLAELVRACNRGNMALAFLVLALGTASAISVAVFLVAVSTIAQAIVLAEPSDWRVVLCLGSLAGFPPLPVFLGRWALVGVALSAGSWPLTVAVSMGVAMTSFGFWRGVARLNLAGSAVQPDQMRSGAATLVPVAAIIGATLAPGTWLITTLLPSTALSSQLGPSPSLTEALIGLALVVLPIMFAAALVRYPERMRRSKTRTRMQRNATRWTIEPAEALAAGTRHIEDRYGLAIGILIAVGTVLALVT